ncbi:unnamed protein product, partial [Musa acuminata var. zebrina]
KGGGVLLYKRSPSPLGQFEKGGGVLLYKRSPSPPPPPPRIAVRASRSTRNPKEKPNRSQVPGTILGTFYSLVFVRFGSVGMGMGMGGNGNGNGTGTATTLRWYRSRG